MTMSASDLGPFTGLRLIHHTATVELFTGFERNGRRPVVLIALTEQAGRDPNWSAEFTDAVAKDATTLGPLDIPVHVSDLYGRRPWAASRIALGRRGAERILAALPGSVPEGIDPSAMFAPLLHPGASSGPQAGWGPAPQPGFSPAPQPAGNPAGPVSGAQLTEPIPATAPPTQGQVNPPPSGPEPNAPLSPAGTSAPAGPTPPLAQSPTPPLVQSPTPPPSAGPLPPGAHNPTVPIPHGSPGSPGRPIPTGPPAPQPQWSSAAGAPSNPVPATGPRNVRGVLLALGAAGTAVFLLLCVVGAVFVVSGKHNDQPTAGAAPTASAPQPAQSTQPPAEAPAGAERPTFKTDVLPVVVAGAVVFADTELTKTIDDPVLPFAFRTPKDWRCSPTAILGGPASDGYACQPVNRADRQQVVVAARRCVDACDQNEQASLSETWFHRYWNREPQPHARDETTTSAEDNGKVSGVYSLVLSHFFADQDTEPLCWQVVVGGSGPTANHTAVQKITNDIRSQTPA